MFLPIGLEGCHAFDFESDMVEGWTFDTVAYKICDFPRHDRERDFAVGEIVVRIASGFFQFGEIENRAIKLADFVRLQDAQSKMADATWFLLVFVNIQVGAVFHSLL